jgi:hypothetical protein
MIQWQREELKAKESVAEKDSRKEPEEREQIQ